MHLVPRNVKLVSLALGGALTITAISKARSAPPQVSRAICVLTPEQNSGVSGVVKFSQEASKPTKFEAKLVGLTNGKHGFHIHELGNLTQGCTTAGPHYNPFNKQHSGPGDSERHVGDLGNITSKGGVASLEGTDELLQLSGPYSIIGRSVVVHASEDDLGKGSHPDSKTTGHAGGRVACGVIGIDS